MGIDLTVSPVAFDGKPLVTSNALPEWCILCMVGAGDLVSEIGGGQKFQLSKEGVGDTSIEWQFVDSVYATSGTGIINNAKLGDYIDFNVYAPASSATSNPGGTGNCNVAPTGMGFNIIVPAAGCGYSDIDLDSDAVLVSVPAEDGYWDWDYPPTGRGTISPNCETKGKWNLYDVGMNLSLFTVKLPIMGHDVAIDFGIQNVRAKMIPPHWKWKVTLHSDTEGNTAEICFFLMMGRARTYLNPVIT